MCNLIYFYHFTVATHFQKCKQLHKKQDVSALDWPNHRGFWSSPGPWTEDLEYAELFSGGSYSLLISDLHTSELDFMLKVCTDAAVAFRNSLNPTLITHRMQMYEMREPCALICVNLAPNTHTLPLQMWRRWEEAGVETDNSPFSPSLNGLNRLHISRPVSANRCSGTLCSITSLLRWFGRNKALHQAWWEALNKSEVCFSHSSTSS